MAIDEPNTKREREKPLAPESKLEQAAKPQRKPYVGARVLVRLSPNGFAPMDVDRVESPTVVSGLAMNSRQIPPYHSIRSAPYSTTDIGGWCWPDEIPTT